MVIELIAIKIYEIAESGNAGSPWGGGFLGCNFILLKEWVGAATHRFARCAAAHLTRTHCGLPTLKISQSSTPTFWSKYEAQIIRWLDLEGNCGERPDPQLAGNRNSFWSDCMSIG